MSNLEFDFKIDPLVPGNDIMATELAGIGFDMFIDTPAGILAYIVEESYNAEKLNILIKKYEPEFKISFSFKKMPDVNWNEEWEKNFEPVLVEDRCCVRASFHNRPAGIIYDIVIDPKMSFGTGHHETTFLMIKEMLDLDFSDKRILDYGCGSGVLSILASKLGAAEVKAIDIDEWAYHNTLENIGINKVNNIAVYKGGIEIFADNIFNVILANINRNVLLGTLKQISERLEKGGILLMSGFFVNDRQVLIEEAGKYSLECISANERNQWSLLRFIKR